MKKLFIIATIGIAGCLSANQSFKSETKIILTSKLEVLPPGWCEVKIYRVNGDGSSTLVGYSYTYEQSESACNKKSNDMLLHAVMGN